MDRRQFLQRSAILAAGAIAADQLELIERLGWRRTIFPAGAGTRVFILGPYGAAASVAVHPLLHRTSFTVPVSSILDLREYRRRYGLQGHPLAFDGAGQWIEQSGVSTIQEGLPRPPLAFDGVWWRS